jgi:hypothetical protein
VLPVGFYLLGYWFLLTVHAHIVIGGGFVASLISRFRFCTVAVSRNSSLCPDSPRNLSLVIS